MTRSITMLQGVQPVNGDVGTGLLTAGNTYTVSSALAHELVNRAKAVYATPSYVAPGVLFVVSRTPTQLAGTPFNEDVALAATTEFVDSTDATKRYTINAAGTAYVQLAGGAGISSLASASDYNANLVTPLAAKQNVPIPWNGTTPALVSGTNPVPAFGSNAFIYTGAGGATLDGNTFQTGDEALWNGTAFIKVVLGGGYLGSFATPALLQTAYPAASNPACIALVGGVIYTSNGATWLTKAALPTGISGATTLNDSHDCANLVCTSTPAITVNAGLKNGFGCSIKGAFTTTGSAAITDLRATSGTAFCCLVQSDTSGAGATYDLVGTK